MKYMLPDLFLELPGNECKSPRDGLKPCKTEDILFLAALLQRAGNARYILETGDGAFVPEPAGVDDPESTETFAVKSRISRATVRGWFRKRFFPFRRMLANGRAPGHEVRFMGKELRSPTRWKPNEPWKLGKSLKWPFERGFDPLLRELHKIPLLSWQEIRPLKNGEVFCPLDGPVVPVGAELISPPVTWERLCGRHWRVLLCPNCLGQFSGKLIMMN